MSGPSTAVPTRALPPAHAWMPTSPCGPGCLECDDPSVRPVTMAIRYTRAAGVLLAALLCAPIAFLAGKRVGDRFTRWVFRALLRAFGIRLAVHGEPLLAEGRGALVVNNHISWLDIVGVNAMRPMRALAKADIARWPVLGGLVARAGTVFVDRERLSALPATVDELAGALRAGSLVNVCAEGTTWCGRASGPFVPAPFQAAIDGGVPVRPVALRYRIANGAETTLPAFIGTESLLESVRRVARLRGLVMEIFVCAEIAPGRAADRRELAALAQSAVQSALGNAAFDPRAAVYQPDATGATASTSERTADAVVR